MVASVLIEYNVKSLNRSFDYLVPEVYKNILKIGNKVLVPFGKTKVEGFVLGLSNDFDNSLEYKEIINIIEKDFYLKEDLLSLGIFMSNKTLSNLISCYQIMLPTALKAREKSDSINRKYETYVYLNKDINAENYISLNQRRKKEIEIIDILSDNKLLKKELNCSALNNLIKNKIVLEEKIEVNRGVYYLPEEKKDIELTFAQKEIFDLIVNETNNKIFLLRGVTGSGKTEIYIKLIEENIKNGKTAILLVPEISLTPQIVSRFKSVFGDNVAVLHSRLSDGEKYDEYRRIMNGEVDVVVGARSAVFAPLDNIGIIIVDECQSSTYKQENTPKYNGIDVAIERARMHGGICVLGSATPLLEQYAKAHKGLYKLIELTKRVSSNLPKIELIDMGEEVKKRNFIISSKLDLKIKETLLKKEQVIILLNRRGYSTFISCSNCGYVYKCPNCDISMIYHKSTNNLICHYCGNQHKMTTICPECHEDAIRDLGLGTEKLEEIIKEKYPYAKILRMDADTVTRKGSYENKIEAFKNHDYDILIGTQMISKGLNFPDVTLVGILNIDVSLSIPDFRSGERTFELLTQTSGRSARYEKEGTVLIQTYNPENYVFKYVLKNDYVNFFNYEMMMRKKLNYPPYFNIALVKIISEEYENARDESKKIKRYLETKLGNDFIILGPSTSRIFKLKNKYYFQIIIKYKYENNLMEVLREIDSNYISGNVRIDVDINPINVL